MLATNIIRGKMRPTSPKALLTAGALEAIAGDGVAVGPARRTASLASRADR